MPALMVLVRGRSGLAAVAVLCTWRPVPHFGGFGLEFSYLKWSSLNSLSSSPCGILLWLCQDFFFKLKVSSELACVPFHFISTAIVTCVSSRQSWNSDLFWLQIEQTYNSHHLMLMGSLQLTDILMMVSYRRPATENLLSQACQSLSSSWGDLHSHKVDNKYPVKLPICSSDQKFQRMVLRSVLMTDRLQIVRYLHPATETLLSPECQ